MELKKIAIFASGNGSNFQAIAEAIQQQTINAVICLLVCDKEHAKVLDKAQKLNIPTFVFNPKQFENKEKYEALILEQLLSKQVEWIVLAGYMRLIGNTILQSYPNKIINIHPSLLPAFKGKDAIKQALDFGVKILGVSVHYVDAGMDTGSIIAQEAIFIEANESEENLMQRVHTVEHKLYIKTLRELFL